jgi:hypothetical protein
MPRWFSTARVVKSRHAAFPWNELLVSTSEDAAAKAAQNPPEGKATFIGRRSTHSAARAQKGSAAMKELLQDFATAAKRAGKRIMVVIDLIGNVGDMADACYSRHVEAWSATKSDPDPSAYVRPLAETHVQSVGCRAWRVAKGYTVRPECDVRS